MIDVLGEAMHWSARSPDLICVGISTEYVFKGRYNTTGQLKEAVSFAFIQINTACLLHRTWKRIIMSQKLWIINWYFDQ